MAIDRGKLNDFVHKALGDMGAALTAALVVIGDKLGLYKALAARGPLTLGRAGRAHRHHRALRARVARRAGGGGYVNYDAGHRPLHAPTEQADGARRRG